MADYNPYVLLPLIINGKPIDGRPIEFDSQPVNQRTMKNAFGNLVKPSKVVTLCPDCGQGLQLAVKLAEPPFQPINFNCPYCRPKPLPMPDPFVNPLQSGRVPAAELDPLLHNPDRPFEEAQGLVVDRFEQVPAWLIEEVASLSDGLSVSAEGEQRVVPLEKAEGLAEEQEFDDSEMVEDG
jgi:hypothetical protein